MWQTALLFSGFIYTWTVKIYTEHIKYNHIHGHVEVPAPFIIGHYPFQCELPLPHNTPYMSAVVCRFVIRLPENSAILHPWRLMRNSYGMGHHLNPNEVIAEVDCDGIMHVSEVLCRQSLEKASKEWTCQAGWVPTDTVCADHVLQVSALHYSARSWVSKGFQRVASAHALHQPTIAVLSIS